MHQKLFKLGLFILVTGITARGAAVPLGNMEGLVVNPFSDTQKFKFNWSEASGCEVSYKSSTFTSYSCDTTGTTLVISRVGTGAKQTTVFLNRCTILEVATSRPDPAKRQYIFDGYYYEKDLPKAAAITATVHFYYELSRPTDVLGKFILKEYEMPYALRATRTLP